MENQQVRRETPMDNIMETIQMKQPVDSETRKWQLSGEDIIFDICQRLRGKRVDENTGKWIDWAEPIMNEWGIQKITELLTNYLNKNMFLSYWEPEQIAEIMIDFDKNISILFEYFWKEMGMNKAIARYTARNISNQVWGSLQRARFGGEKQFIEGTEQRRIISTEGQQRPENIWDKIPILGGKK